MASENVDKRSVSKSPSLLVYSLLALGVISVLSGLVAAIVVVAAELAAESSGQMAVLEALGVMVAGGCVGAVMWALAWLCRRYWFPVYAQVRRGGVAADEARDHVQGDTWVFHDERVVKLAPEVLDELGVVAHAPARHHSV